MPRLSSKPRSAATASTNLDYAAGWFPVPKSLVINHGAKLRPYALAAYLVITMHANKDGECWPRLKRLASLAGMSQRQMRRQIPKLVNAGLLTVEEHPGLETHFRIDPGLIVRTTPDQQSAPPRTNSPRPRTNSHKQAKAPLVLNKTYEQERRKPRFTPPSIDEIRAYCLERHNSVDAQTFSNFYQSKDWMVGRNKMTDWQAAVRTWESKDRRSSNGKAPTDIYSGLAAFVAEGDRK